MRLFDLAEAPSPHRQVLEREVRKLRKRDDVRAVGVAGSVASGDTWPGSDLDIEVVLRGDKPKEVINTEQEISVDYGYFGESLIKEIPDDTRPIYDPTGLLTAELASRDRVQTVRRDISEAVNQSQDLLTRGAEALGTDPYSGLFFVHLAAWLLCYSFILASGERWTIRRAISRLDSASKKSGRSQFFEDFGSLLGFPETIERAGELMVELQQGYRDVWPYFKDKQLGPAYMRLQPDSEAWFKNRIEPLYDYDKRNIPMIVYEEFPFVTYYVFRLSGHERTPINVFEEARKFEGPAALWSARHRRILDYFSAQNVRPLLDTASRLLGDVKRWRSLAWHDLAVSKG